MKKSYLGLLLLSLFLPLFAPSHSYGLTKKALLVGINNYKNLPFFSSQFKRTITNLKGSINDVVLMKQVLVSYFGFRNEDILVLEDSEATREKILDGFNNWLIKGTKEGDLAVFYFSGHGTQVPESVPGNEPDHLDEALCPYDVVPSGAGSVDEAKLIIDDEIGVLLRKLRGRDVVFIADCCHSRTLTRGIRGVPVSNLEPTPGYQARFLPVIIKGVQLAGNRLINTLFKKNFRSEGIPEGQVYLYSCRENQVSIEMPLSGRFYGVFTKLFVEGIEHKKGEITYRDLYAYVKKRMRDGYSLGVSQDPEVEPKQGKILERRVFSSGSADISGLAGIAMEKSKEPAQIAAKPAEPSMKSYVPSVTRGLPRLPLLPEQSMRREKLLVRMETLEGRNLVMTRALQRGLTRIPYVEVVEDESFDRLIRGKLKDGEFYASVLNRVGDAEEIPPKNNIEDLIRAIDPALEYAYNTKELSRIRHRSPPFQVTISLPDERRDFGKGETIVYTISCEDDSYLLILSLDSRGSFQVILPDQYNFQSDLVKAGTKIQIPEQFISPGERTFKIIATNARLTSERAHRANSSGGFMLSATAGMKEILGSKERIKEILGWIEEKTKQRDFKWSEDTVILRIH